MQEQDYHHVSVAFRRSRAQALGTASDDVERAAIRETYAEKATILADAFEWINPDFEWDEFVHDVTREELAAS